MITPQADQLVRERGWITIPATTFGTGEIRINPAAIYGYEDRGKGSGVTLFTTAGPIDLRINVQRDAFIEGWMRGSR